MVPATYSNFFAAGANAGAALAGLLFLAVTVGPIPTVGRRAPVERNSVATSAFVALINAFIISLGALIPGANVGVIALPAGVAALVATARTGHDLAEGQHSVRATLRRLVLVGVSALLYGIEAWQSAQLLLKPDDPVAVGVLASILLPVFAIGVLRAWELVGAERHGFLARFSPLRDLDKAMSKTE